MKLPKCAPSFSPGLNKGDKIIFCGRVHTITEITFDDPRQTGIPEKYCKCVCDQWAGVYVLSEATLGTLKKGGAE